MKRYKLTAEPRKITGKKIKKLRREGILPANVYGKDIKSQSLQLPMTEFLKVFEEAGETGVVDLEVGKDVIPVLIHNLHKDYRNMPLHADFFKVNLKEKVKAMIPIELTGEPIAVTEKIGLLEKITNEIEVEALPTELPEKFELNITALRNIDDQITVEMAHKPKGVEILSDPNLVIVKIGELVSKETQEQIAEEAAAAEAAAAEGAEGAEGETPTEGGKETSKENQEEPARDASQNDAGGKPQE